MDATTLPTLLLGGDPQGDPQDTYAVVGPGARPARRARSRRRSRPALPARRRRRRGRRHRRASWCTGAGWARERQRTLGAPARDRRHGRVVGRDRRRPRRLVAHRSVCRATSLPGESRTVAAGRVGARRRAAVRVRRRSRPSTPTARSTRRARRARVASSPAPPTSPTCPRDSELTVTADGGPARVAVCRRPRGGAARAAVPARGRRGRARRAARRRQSLARGPQLRRPRRARRRLDHRLRGPHPGRQLELLPAAQARRGPRRASRPSSRRSTTSRSRPSADGAGAAGADPVGYQRVYGTAERPIDVLAEVRTGRRRPRAARLARPGDGGPRLRPVLPQRHGRPRRRSAPG